MVLLTQEPRRDLAVGGGLADRVDDAGVTGAAADVALAVDISLAELGDGVLDAVGPHVVEGSWLHFWLPPPELWRAFVGAGPLPLRGVVAGPARLEILAQVDVGEVERFLGVRQAEGG